MGSTKVMTNAKDDNEANEFPEGLRPALARLRNLVNGAWLKVVLTTRFVIEKELNYPKNSDMLSDLEEIEGAAKLLINKLEDPRIQSLLSDGDDTWSNGLNPTWRGLYEIADRAKRVRTGIPRKRGDSRYFPGGADGPNAMQTCALMVAIAHYKGCGEWLNGKNEREECEALWRQAGGGPRKGAVRGENSFGVWRKHLGTAKDYYTHDFGKHIVNNILVARGLFEKPPKAD